MANVLFVTWDGGGNVPPALAIAAELQRRGDTVTVLGHAQQRETFRGQRFVPFAHAREWSVVTRRGMLAPLQYAAVFSDKGMVRDLADAVARDSIDYAVIDGLLIGAMEGAARVGLPYSVLVHSLLSVTDTTLNRGPLTPILAAKGLNPRRLYAGARSVIAATLRELDTAPDSPTVHHTGPMVSGVAATPGQLPVVLVSLSTTYIAGQDATLQRILDALAELPIRVVLTTGPAVQPSELRAPANAEVHAFVPHAELMPGASLVITHGGHATTMLALAHDLPVLVMPMTSTFDQPTIGRAIEGAGAGLWLPRSAPAARIRQAVERLLTQERYRVAAAELGAGIRLQNAPAAAADALARAHATSDARR